MRPIYRNWDHYKLLIRSLTDMALQSCCQIVRFLGLTLPDNVDTPSHLPQIPPNKSISGNIRKKLFIPKLCPSFWRVCKLATSVPVPKTSVNKYHQIPFWEDDIWLSWEVFCMKSESESKSMQYRAHNAFRSRIAALNLRHIPATPLFREFIHCDSLPKGWGVVQYFSYFLRDLHCQ